MSCIKITSEKELWFSYKNETVSAG